MKTFRRSAPEWFGGGNNNNTNGDFSSSSKKKNKKSSSNKSNTNDNNNSNSNSSKSSRKKSKSKSSGKGSGHTRSLSGGSSNSGVSSSKRERSIRKNSVSSSSNIISNVSSNDKDDSNSNGTTSSRHERRKSRENALESQSSFPSPPFISNSNHTSPGQEASLKRPLLQHSQSLEIFSAKGEEKQQQQLLSQQQQHHQQQQQQQQQWINDNHRSLLVNSSEYYLHNSLLRSTSIKGLPDPTGNVPPPPQAPPPPANSTAMEDSDDLLTYSDDDVTTTTTQFVQTNGMPMAAGFGYPNNVTSPPYQNKIQQPQHQPLQYPQSWGTYQNQHPTTHRQQLQLLNQQHRHDHQPPPSFYNSPESMKQEEEYRRLQQEQRVYMGHYNHHSQSLHNIDGKYKKAEADSNNNRYGSFSYTENVTPIRSNVTNTTQPFANGGPKSPATTRNKDGADTPTTKRDIPPDDPTVISGTNDMYLSDGSSSSHVSTSSSLNNDHHFKFDKQTNSDASTIHNSSASLFSDAADSIRIGKSTSNISLLQSQEEESKQYEERTAEEEDASLLLEHSNPESTTEMNVGGAEDKVLGVKNDNFRHESANSMNSSSKFSLPVLRILSPNPGSESFHSNEDNGINGVKSSSGGGATSTFNYSASIINTNLSTNSNANGMISSPPLHSVRIVQINGTNATASSTGSLHPFLQQLPPQQQQQRILSRKEIRRLKRMRETANIQEELVQSILGNKRIQDFGVAASGTPGRFLVFQGGEDGEDRNIAFGGDLKRGEKDNYLEDGANQKEKVQDLPFAILFLIQLLFIVYIAVQYGGLTTMISSPKSSSSSNTSSSSSVSSFSSKQPSQYLDPFDTNPNSSSSSGTSVSIWEQDIHVDYQNAIKLSCIAGMYATSLSALTIGMMMILGKSLIQSALCFTVLLCFAWSTIGVALSPYNFVPVLGIIALALSLGYTVVVWDRIPFAATNLNTALCGMRCTVDIIMVGFGMMILAFCWSIGWTFAFLGLYDHHLGEENSRASYGRNGGSFEVGGSGDSDATFYYGNVILYLGMLTSYLWTLNVIMNIVHVSVAGTISTWWLNPDNVAPCCASASRKPFQRSFTSSFGSICLGSLVVPPAQVLEMFFSTWCFFYRQPPPEMQTSETSVDLESSIRSDTSPVAGIYYNTGPCSCIVDSFNEFGLTYVAIYGDSFVTAGKKATAVFKARDWMGAVSDRLISHILSMAVFVISLSTGCFGLVVEEFDGYSFTNFETPSSTSFLIGFFIGLILSSVILRVVRSSVNTILVCFAVAPFEFQQVHPVLSDEMRTSWGGVWMDESIS